MEATWQIGAQITGPADQEPPPHPSPLPMGGEGEREQNFVESTPEFDSITQVGATRAINAVAPSPFRRGGKGAYWGPFKS
ncbi:hypothetical protein CQ009_08650 [Pseudomonas sp. MYb2]|nr:hypothetical protein CQ025_01420 [Pseudomonas sp. MYb3]PRC35582.1 hypothetical protein CQ009_08650 [Pseudomonas sp. MYb2]